MLSNHAETHLPLLHIDGNPKELLIFRDAFVCSSTRFRLYDAANLEAAARHFVFRPPHDQPDCHPRPVLILLGYQIGLHTAPDFLYWLRVMKSNTAIPVIVSTNSATAAQVSDCYANGASHCLSKQGTIPGVMKFIRTLNFCLSFRHPHLDWLDRLPEYLADRAVVPEN